MTTAGFDLDGLILAAKQAGLDLHLTIRDQQHKERGIVYLDQFRENPAEASQVTLGIIQRLGEGR